MYCEICEELCEGQLCPSCQPLLNRPKEPKTLLDLKVMYGTGWSSKLRSLARKNKPYLGKTCWFCPYDRHMEICHIKPVKDFPLTTSIDVVNSISNLVALCPTHHWEFDKGILSL